MYKTLLRRVCVKKVKLSFQNSTFRGVFHYFSIIDI